MGLIGTAGQEEGTNKISFENFSFSGGTKKFLWGVMDEESSGRKIWVICQILSETLSRLLTERKGGRLCEKLIFVKRLSQF